MSKKESGLAFDGMAGDGVNRASNRYSGNQSGLTMKENFGAGPRRGNLDIEKDEAKEGKSVTKDPMKRAPDTARGLKPVEGSVGKSSFGNPNKINVG
jgi:hypothetical protein